MEAFDDVIIGIAPVCFRFASVLFDLGLNFSYVSTYFTTSFDFVSDPFNMPIHISTYVGDSLVVDWVYLSWCYDFCWA